uniref:Uncharacterized protein n=1 Tax=Globisporangium ultimum (strain ATCC 200006 / CBS 805.95 / DAOM BR144) TaxID=431595 RepID=K3WXF2_GLOUD
MQKYVFHTSGILGVSGVFFEPIVLMCEFVEIALQTTQVYQCSVQTFELTQRLVVANCFSSLILRRVNSSLQGKHCVVVLAVNLVLDITYVIQAVMEMPMLFVISYLDLITKLWPPIGIYLMLHKIELLVRRRQSTLPDNPCCNDMHTAMMDVKFSVKWIQHSVHIEKWLYLLLSCWDTLITIVFIVAVFAITPECHPGCLLVVQPWLHAPQRCQCVVLEVNCFALDISGAANQIRPILHATNTKGLLSLIFIHCPTLDVPQEIHRFSDLFGVTLFNCSIALWDDSAAISDNFFPHLGYIVLVHAFICEIPRALAHSDLPRSLSEIDIVVSNLLRLPENLHMQ